MHTKNLAKQFRVTDGRKFRLKDFKHGADFSKERSAELVQHGLTRISDLQAKLYADDRWSLLLIFQAMDAAGKDGAIKHVMSGVNPLGCQVYSFKAPSAEELDHDFLWRTSKCLPEQGRIGIFNRSYYEEVLAVRVHPEFLKAQKLPPCPGDIWKERFEAINAHERFLSRNGTVVRKFFLNLSREEQKKRFLDRLDRPEKNWKFSTADAKERQHWDEYMRAYEDMIRNTSTSAAPWYVVPADNKWFARLVVSHAIVDALESLDLHFPKIDRSKRQELKQVRSLLLAETA